METLLTTTLHLPPGYEAVPYYAGLDAFLLSHVEPYFHYLLRHTGPQPTGSHICLFHHVLLGGDVHSGKFSAQSHPLLGLPVQEQLAQTLLWLSCVSSEKKTHRWVNTGNTSIIMSNRAGMSNSCYIAGPHTAHFHL